MATCNDIYVNIHDYNSENTYLVFLVPIDSVIIDPIIPSLAKTATGPGVLFQGLTSTEYKACIRKTCPNGVISEVCKLLVSTICPVPTNVVISDITVNSANLNYTVVTGNTYQISVNGGPYIDKGTTNPIPLTGLNTGATYTVDIRSSCGAGKYSFPVRREFTTTAITSTFVKNDLSVACNGTVYLYHRIRFTLSGGVPSIGTIYTISAPPSGSIASHTVKAGDTMKKIIDSLTASLVVGTKTTTGNNSGYFTIDIKDPNVSALCSDVPLESTLVALLSV